MGFLKFLKREKKEDRLGEIDLPPAPPTLEGFDESIPDFPDFGEGKFDESKISADDVFQKLDFPETEEGFHNVSKENIMQDFPAFPKIEKNPLISIPPVRATQAMPWLEPEIKPAVPLPQPLQPEPLPDKQEAFPDVYKKQTAKNLEHDKKALRQSLNVKEVYVRIDKFKSALGSINIIRNDLKSSEETLVKLENIKNAKDKSVDKVKSFMDDLQKKLIFVDKTLFEGE